MASPDEDFGNFAEVPTHTTATALDLPAGDEGTAASEPVAASLSHASPAEAHAEEAATAGSQGQPHAQAMQEQPNAIAGLAAAGTFDDDDDDFGDFDEAPAAAPSASAQPMDLPSSGSTGGPAAAAPWPSSSGPSAAAFLQPATTALPQPAPYAAPREDPDLLALSDDDFRRAAAAAWHGRPPPAAPPKALQLLLQQARARLTPADVEPGSILFHCGIPLAASAPHRPPTGLAAGGPKGLPPSAQPLGQVYQPVIKCSSQLQWCGSASEQRLLTSLGLWDIAQQVLEAEAAAVAAAGMVSAARQPTVAASGSPLVGGSPQGQRSPMFGQGSVSSNDDQGSEGTPAAALAAAPQDALGAAA